MSTLIHCDREGCPQSRKEYPPPTIPDPWLKVESFDANRYSTDIGWDRIQHFCSARHAADQLHEDAQKGRR